MPVRIAAILVFLFPLIAYCQTSEEAVREALKLLRSREKDMLNETEVAKLRTAIRSLEKYGPKTPDVSPVLIPVAKDAAIADKLKKRVAGKLSVNKAGEYVLSYDFNTKQQLNDFEVGIKRVAVANSLLAIEAGDELRHKARWKSFVCSAGMNVATTNGAGIGTSNGTWFTPEHTPRSAEPHSGSLHIDILPPRRTSRVFGAVAHTGKVPMLVSINKEKLAIRIGQAILHAPNHKPNEMNQIILRGGPDGASFSELEITGELDPIWIDEMLKEEPAQP